MKELSITNQIVCAVGLIIGVFLLNAGGLVLWGLIITGVEYDGTREISEFHMNFFFISCWVGLFVVPPVIAFLNWRRRSEQHRQAILNSIMEE